jgi:hypothetical protein
LADTLEWIVEFYQAYYRGEAAGLIASDQIARYQARSTGLEILKVTEQSPALTIPTV